MQTEIARTFAENPERWFTVSELLGTNLDSFQRGEARKFRCRAPEVIKQIAKDILSALEALHKLKIGSKSAIHICNIVMSISN